MAELVALMPPAARQRISKAAGEAIGFWSRAPGMSDAKVRYATIAAIEVTIIAEGGLRWLGGVRS